MLYSSNGGGKSCKSIFFNYGKSFTAKDGEGEVFPTGSDPEQVMWWCHGYDVFCHRECLLVWELVRKKVI